MDDTYRTPVRDGEETDRCARPEERVRVSDAVAARRACHPGQKSPAASASPAVRLFQEQLLVI